MPGPSQDLTMLDRYRGSLLGGALGDAMGRPTEFTQIPNAGLDRIDLPRPALVTDDTQMSLVVARALPGGIETLGARLTAGLGEWRTEADHAGRAPGTTCLAATGNLAAGMPWRLAAVADSKGCGGVMRAHPCAFTPSVGGRDLAIMLSVVQSAMTHGHPTAHVAAACWAAVIQAAAAGWGPNTWSAVARRTAEWPLPLTDRLRDDLGGAETLRTGAKEMLAALDRLDDGLRIWNTRSDPCTITGEGWTAEDAVASALLVSVTYAAEPHDAVRRAARTCGDSDTLAAMTGALLGARYGVGTWPVAWVEALEEPYRSTILGMPLPVLTSPSRKD